MALRFIILTSLLFLHGGPLTGCLPKGTKAAKVAKTPVPTPTPRPVETISPPAPVQGGFLTGELMQNDGTPLTDAEVSIVLQEPSSILSTGSLLWLTSFFLDDPSVEFATTTDESGHFAIPIEKIASARVRLRINDGVRKLVSDISLPPDLASGINQARVFAGLAPLADLPETQTSGTGTTNTSTLGSLTERKLALQLPVNRTSGPADAATAEVEEETLPLVVSSLPVPTESDAKTFGLWRGIENFSNDDVVGLVWQNPFTEEGKTRIVFTKVEADLSYWNGEEKSAPKYSGIISGANIITAYTGCNDPTFRTSASGPLTSKSDSRCGLKKSQFPFNAGNDVYIRAATEFDGSIRLSPVWKIAAKNKAPILNSIGPQSINIGSNSLQLPLELSDPDSTLACHLALSVQSTNSEILPAQNIVIAGDKTPNCSLHLYPVPEKVGTSTLTVVAKDEGSLTASRSFSFWVRNPNLPPSLNPVDDVQTQEDTPSTVPVTIVDSDGPEQACSSDFLSYTSSNTAVVASTGAIIWGGEWPNCTATVATVLHSNTTDHGNVEISLSVNDGSLTSDAQTFALTVTPVNDAPVVGAISAQITNEDTATNPISFAITDVDGPEKSCSSAFLTYTSSNTTVVAQTGAVAWNGTWPNCTAVVTPLLDASGTTDLTVSANDGDKTGEGQRFALTVNAVNDAPRVESIAPQTTQEDTASPAIAVKVLDDDNTPKECNSTYLFYTSSAAAVVNNSGAVTWGGTWPNCTATFVPVANASGTPILSVAASDGTAKGNATEFTLTVEPTNDAPTILSINDASINEDYPTGTISITITDADTNSSARTCDNTSLSYTSSQTSVIGASGATTWGGTWPNCTATITPVVNAHGSALITFKAYDGIDWSDGESFTLTVNPVNDAPIVGPIYDLTTVEDTSTNAIAIQISDVDVGSPAWSCTSQYLSYTSDAVAPVAASGAVVWNGTWPNCTAVITPTTNAHGDALITISAYDGSAWSAGTSFKLTVSADNDAPLVEGITAQTTNEDTLSVAIPVIVSDVDVPDTAKSCDANFLFYTSGNPLLVASTGAVTWSGTWPNCFAIVAPLANANGSATLTFSASDGEDVGLGSSFTLTVNALNDAPTISAISDKTTNEDTATAAIAVTVNDVDLNSPNRSCNSTFLSYTSGNTNLVAASNAVTWGGTWPNCTAVITPLENASGAATIRISASDGIATGSEQTFTVTVASVNDAPTIATIPAQSTNEDTATGQIAVTVTDADGPSRSCDSTYLSYSSNNIFAVAASGAVAWSGTWPNCKAVFTPVPDGIGTTTITLRATDGTDQGAPQIFSLNVVAIPQWLETANIRRSNMISHFGAALALSADTVAVGASGDSVLQSTITNGATEDTNTYSASSNSGAVFVYRKNGSGWVQEAYLKASNSDSNDQLGRSVSLSGDTLAAGADFEDSSQTTITMGDMSAMNNTAPASGAVYVFGRSGTNWSSEAYIKAANAEAGDIFGSSVALNGSALAVGAIGERSSETAITNGTGASSDNQSELSGAVYVYRKTAGQWSQEAYVKAANSSAFAQFGFSVALSADTLAVGAQSEDAGHNTITNGTTATTTSQQPNSGAIYVYRKSISGWAQEAYVKAVNAGSADEFGSAVALSGELLAVGAPFEDSQQTVISNNSNADTSNTNPSSGAVYVYRRNGTQWEQEAFIKAANSDASDQFGSAVSLSGSTLAVGAPNEASEQSTVTNGTTASENNAAANRGAVYVYRRLGSSWSQEAYVKASSSSCGEKFGTSVSLSGDTLAGGADGCSGSTGGFFALFKNTSRMYDPDVRITGKTQNSISFSWGNNLGSSSTVKVAIAALGSTSASSGCEGGTPLNAGATTYSYSGLTAGTKYGFRFCTTDGNSTAQGTTLWEATLP